VRSIEWRDGRIALIDQTALPDELRTIEVATVDDLVDAIERLAVRGAPALGAAGALGVVVALRQSEREGWDRATLEAAIDRLRAARPTAANLAWGVDRARARISDGTDAVEREALLILAEDAAANRAIGDRGADLIAELVGEHHHGALRLHTHCNTGALATVEWGTALGIVRTLHQRDRALEVYVDETRPLLQGSRLTAWELERLGVPYRVVVDGAGPSVIARGLVDAVVVGADRIAGNGDVVNKIGTYPLALAAARAGVPFIVAAPESTIDTSTPTGDGIVIEARAADEVVTLAGVRTAPEAAEALNLAFDVTPSDLVTAIVTERRVVRPAAGEKPG
jgi:S-methyl-5-thioribose-1-phosphate isomerase